MGGKRSHGEGYVKQLKNGTWRGQMMDGYRSDGKKNVISFHAPTKRELLSKMREYQSQRENNVHLDRNITLTEWSNQWYKGYSDQVQPSTYASYQYTLKIIQSHLGDRKLAQILPMDIERFIRTLSGEYSESQVSKCRSMLIQIYDEADANGIVSRNPARKAKKPRNIKVPVDVSKAKEHNPDVSEPNKKAKDSFTEEEVRLLCEQLPEDLLGHSIRVMLMTGIREQELLALSKDDIAEDGSTITVNKAIKTVDGKSMLGSPKSDRSNRCIPVPEDYRGSLIFLREHGREPFIWTRSWKNPLCAVKTFRNQFYRAIEQIPGVRRLSPHCCRHTYVTQLEAKGVPMEQIARLAGHSRIETTNGYLHTSMNTLARSVSVLNAKEVV